MRWNPFVLVLVLLLVAGGSWWVVKRLGAPSVPETPDSKKPSPPAPRPNVLLVSLDTLRPDHLGCYGYDRKTSPNLDAFARQSVLFTNCRAQASWTLPSHMSLFTSMLPSANGVDNINKVLPAEIPTLAEILRGEGYRTAALVNNGQMRAGWGFNRGFDPWREFEADTPAGDCEHITAEAVSWLKSNAAGEPFFLFLHYYDTHDPYAAPEPYRRALGTTLTGKEARQLCFGHRSPGQTFDDPGLLSDLLAAYDAEIAWLDHEFGKLLAAVPANTLVVLFSDHGEAFKEHGWMLHGATLYEEEIRTVLLMRLPEPQPKSAVVSESVMLMDVAPTILTRCGIQPPGGFQGLDLSRLWEGSVIKQRLIPSESKAVLEGRLSLSAVLYPLKGVYSLFDGRFELYRLPDEQKPLGDADRTAAEAIFKPLREWIGSEEYWMIHAVGQGDFEATVELSEGRFGLFIPVGLDPLRDSFEPLDDGRALRWHVYPGGKRAKSLFLQPANPEAALRVDFKINGSRSKEMVFVGKDRKHPDAVPATVPTDIAPITPVIEKPFAAEKEGFYVFRHQSAGSRSRPAKVEPLDEQTIRQLKSLGYLQ